MKMKQMITAVMFLLLLTVVLTSCQSGKPDGGGTETEPPDTFVTAGEVKPIPTPTDHCGILQINLEGIADTAPESFSYTEDQAGIRITGYTGSAKQIRVPETINGKAVIAIEKGAFRNNSALTAIVLPEGLQTIGFGVLEGCSALTLLHTPFLGASAEAEEQFLGYLFGANVHTDNPLKIPASLIYLSIGSGLTALPDYALFDCNDLVAVCLSEQITRIGAYALYNCASLEDIDLTRVEFIGEHALYACASLTELELSTALQSIGAGALEGCVGLRSLTLPFVGQSKTENTYLGYVFGAVVPEFSAGYYPGALTHVTLLEGCTALGNYAFFECDTLAYVTMEEGIASIGLRAFYGCRNLRQINLPDTLQAVREYAFAYCLNLREVTFGEVAKLNALGINAFFGCRSLKEISLPQSLKNLPASCFADCETLEKIDLGGVGQIGVNAFRNCEALTEATAHGEMEIANGNDCVKALIKKQS